LLIVQIRATGRLITLGFFYSAIKIAEDSSRLLEAVLDEIQQIVGKVREEANPDAAVQSWLWDDVDRRLLVGSLAHIPAIKEYANACQTLSELGLHGVHSLLAIELELITKVRYTACIGSDVNKVNNTCQVSGQGALGSSVFVVCMM
jgi:hypothetical protein